MFSEKTDNILDVIFLSFGAVWMLSFCLILGNIFKLNNEIVYVISVFISLNYIPRKYIKKKYSYFLKDINKINKIDIVMFLFGNIFLIYFYIKTNNVVAYLPLVIIKFMVVAISEEILYRIYLQKILEKIFTVRIALLLQSFMFAFILHSGLPVILNLLLRFPIGIILTCIYKKNNRIDIPILIHYFYNFIIIMIF